MQNKKEPTEIRGTDRVFRIDRDAVLVYTGQGQSDFHPFIRIGTGKRAPTGVLKNIENVVLAENDPPNMGLELAWMQGTIEEGGEIRYVGSRDRINQIYSCAGIENKAESPQIKAAPYQPFKPSFVGRDKSVVTFFETGNFSILVGGNRCYDFDSFRKSLLTIDKEYDLISRALSKRKRRAESGVGFTVVTTSGNLPCIHWHFGREGLLVEPPADYHYKLFELAIDPANVSMAIAHSAHTPGFNEFLRRKNQTKGLAGAYCTQPDKITPLKKVYDAAQIKIFDDARTLPTAKDVSFYTTKTGSNGLFAMKLDENSERHVQVMFPINGAIKQSRSFDYFRAPHDLELREIRSADDLKETVAHLTLHFNAGGLKAKQYDRSNLQPGLYPIVPRCEYKLAYSESYGNAMEQFLPLMAETPYGKCIASLYAICGGNPEEGISIDQTIRDFRELPRIKDPVLLNNVHEALRFLTHTPGFQSNLEPIHQKRVHGLLRRYGIHRLRVSDWMTLSASRPEIHVLFYSGKQSYLFVKEMPSDVIPLRIETITDRTEDAKAARMRLRSLSRALDKANDPPGYRQCLELLEKITEEQIKIAAEKKRFEDFLVTIGLAPSVGKSVDSRLPAWLRDFRPLLSWLKNVWVAVNDRLRDFTTAFQ